jgi:hypothetical protein
MKNSHSLTILLLLLLPIFGHASNTKLSHETSEWFLSWHKTCLESGLLLSRLGLSEDQKNKLHKTVFKNNLEQIVREYSRFKGNGECSIDSTLTNKYNKDPAQSLLVKAEATYFTQKPVEKQILAVLNIKQRKKWSKGMELLNTFRIKGRNVLTEPTELNKLAEQMSKDLDTILKVE